MRLSKSLLFVSWSPLGIFFKDGQQLTNTGPVNTQKGMISCRCSSLHQVMMCQKKRPGTQKYHAVSTRSTAARRPSYASRSGLLTPQSQLFILPYIIFKLGCRIKRFEQLTTQLLRRPNRQGNLNLFVNIQSPFPQPPHPAAQLRKRGQSSAGTAFWHSPAAAGHQPQAKYCQGTQKTS